MGIIHKLKEEVINCIVEKKKEEPFISCRQLAEATSAKFNIKVSKSSINTVLKKLRLSSSVGRRPFSTAKSKKFQIPPQKKKQLFESISGLGFTFEEKQQKVKPSVQIQKNKTDKSKKERKTTAFSLERLSKDLEKYNNRKKEIKQKDVLIVPVGHQFFDEKRFFYKVEDIRKKNKEQKKNRILFEKAGAVFLKAAQLEILNKSFLAQIFLRHVKGLRLQNFDDVCNSLLFWKIFDILAIKDAEKTGKYALWPVKDYRTHLKEKNFFEWTENINFSRSLVFEYFSEKEQSLLKISTFKLILEDSTNFIIDAQMMSLWRGNIPCEMFCPVNKAMTVLSRHIISNNKPFVIDAGVTKGLGVSDIDKLICSFEDIKGKKIRKIEILDEKNNKIAEFSLIPSIRRIFLIGFWPWQNIYKEIIQKYTSNTFFPYYDKQTDKVIYFSEKKISLSDFFQKSFKSVGVQRVLRVVFLSNRKGQPPELAILTNLKSKDTDQIISDYLFRWPTALEEVKEKGSSFSQQERKASFVEESPLNPFEKLLSQVEISNIDDIFKDFIFSLHNYCKNHYFPLRFKEHEMNSITENFYGLPGYIEEGDTCKVVTLRCPRSCQQEEYLRAAVYNVNKRCILDELGRKLLIKIEKEPS